MASSDMELEQQLLEAGNELLDPPSSVDELLPLLDKVESLLSRVEQSPAESIQDALSSFVKTLIADKLFTHPDEEVKVVVASCISEITRITAPDAPYEDHQMKDVFRLIVSSFKNLHDKSSRSYAKRISILETVARVRSCVVMLDLECDALILEMFQHFLNSIRDYHSKHVFQSMVTIMTLIIEESEDVSSDLLDCLLASVKKDNKEVTAVARMLVEEVLKNCASTLKPCLGQVLQSLGSSLDDYSDIVASICQDADTMGMNDMRAPGGYKVDKLVPPRKNPGSRSPKLRMGNAVMQKKEVDPASMKEEHLNRSSQSKSDTALSTGRDGELDSEDAANLDSHRENNKRKGRQLDGSHTSKKKEAKKLLQNHIEPDNSNPDDELPSESKKETPVKPLPKAEDMEDLSTVSPSQSGGEQAVQRSKKRGRQKKREDLKEVSLDAVELSEKEPEGISDSDAKAHLRLGKKKSAGGSLDGKGVITLKITRKISDASGEVEEKHGKDSSKKAPKSMDVGDGSSMKKQRSKKQLSSGKKATETVLRKSSVKEKKNGDFSSPKSPLKSSRDEQRSFETSKASSKKKGTPGKESSSVKDYGTDLIGSKIRVWWPQDRQFYEGVVDSFDSAKKKHKVAYMDGDEEILNLKKEKWEFVADTVGSDQEQAVGDGSADASPELPLKKRVKRGMEESTAKERKKEAMSMKGGDASSSKGKSASLKSGQKTGVGNKSGGKPGRKSNSASKDVTMLNGRKSASAASGNADKSDKDEGKASDSIESMEDDDLRTLKASIKSKGRAGKAKDLKGSSPENKSKSGGKPEEMNSDGLENQKANSLNTEESGGVDTDPEDVAERNEPKEGESSVPKKEKGIAPKSGKKRSRGA